MSFMSWFRRWCFSLFRLITIGYKKRKSKKQLEKERRKRHSKMFSASNLYRTKKKRAKRRSSISVQQERTIRALFGFISVSLGILLLPFGLFDYGRKRARARKRAAAASTKRKPDAYSGRSELQKAQGDKANGIQHTQQTHKSRVKSDEHKLRPLHTATDIHHANSVLEVDKAEEVYTAQKLFSISTDDVKPEVVSTVSNTVIDEIDENTPKSTPQNVNDQYIRKRMIIAGSSYCDTSILHSLSVGTRIELELERDNPYDKDAVRLTFSGEKIGYVARKDKMAYVTCLKIGRGIYGIITDIKNEDGQVKYEFETWFDSQM